ncbi:MAG TPA: VOC family protein [Burkholderiales bacterium]|nr:VOC family protein [Burkholderiales bacterium]
MSFRILGTNHTSFTVSDLERSIAFLRDCLGFKVVSKAPRDPALVSRITGVEGADMMIAFLKAPGHTLELIEYRAPATKGKVSARPCDTGFAHVAFNVDDAQAAVDAASGYGVKAISPPVTIDQGPNKGRKVVYVRDWDGVTFEFIEAAR